MSKPANYCVGSNRTIVLLKTMWTKKLNSICFRKFVDEGKMIFIDITQELSFQVLKLHDTTGALLAKCVSFSLLPLELPNQKFMI